ncbi:YitT family protein [Paenibacillus rhizovicinus]|uniref:YitT family protein n=1 Tax=Paenibacillus rhizovicinus TaxID=2704463 RepID=A0A6C0P0C8_9BACL|nr:YitT family protein [Paenibacillus rhizovicinus]QHW30162.1 YitT family protein [Paenibacillus rhizovicinus]
MKTTSLQMLRNLIPVMIGTAIYAFGLHYFLLPNQLMEGGVTGIAILLNYAMGWPLSISTLVLNIPLFVIGYRILGKSHTGYTVFGAVSLSVFLALMEKLIAIGWVVPFRTSNDYILAVLYAGVTLGTGLGIVFRFGGTTGGVDIVARIASKLKGWSMGQVILTLDIVIIGLSLLYIPKEKVLYTLVAVFIASKLIDFIQEGAYAAKEFSIITELGDEIGLKITTDMDRGVTLFPAKGVYSGKEKQVVYCVVARHEIRMLKSIVRGIDPRAFIVINDVHDVLGEGFKEE